MIDKRDVTVPVTVQARAAVAPQRPYAMIVLTGQANFGPILFSTQKTEGLRLQALLRVELAGVESATSWVRCVEVGVEDLEITAQDVRNRRRRVGHESILTFV